ncbi:hypothetical protein SDJN02_06498, partial [Cucurbita argyrosperma subsp. argyrosperma]
MAKEDWLIHRRKSFSSKFKLHSQVIAIQIPFHLQLRLPIGLRRHPSTHARVPSTYCAPTPSLVKRRRRVFLPRGIFSAGASIGGDAPSAITAPRFATARTTFWQLDDFWRGRTTRTHMNTIQ